MSWQRTLIVLLIGAAGAVAQGTIDSNERWVSKCLNPLISGSLSFHCPKHHVLQDINVIYGVKSTNNANCSYSSSNCHVRPTRLLDWTKGCRWKQSCDLYLEDLSLELARNQPNSECKGGPDYISYVIPKCIRENHLFFICPGKNKRIKDLNGIVKSECEKITRFRKVKCRRRFTWPVNSTVQFLVKGKKKTESVRLIWPENGKIKRLYLKNERIQTFTVPNYDITLVWKNRENIPTRPDFQVYFKVTSSEEMIDLLDSTNSPVNVNSDLLHRISEEYANVTEDVDWEQKSLTFTCPEHSVIYSASLTLGKLSETDTDDGERLLQCPGKSSNLLMQESECHWQRSCDITWDGPSPIVSSNQIDCFGQRSDVIEYQDFKCIPQDSVLDVCSGGSNTLKARGVIRSHSDYPWNYAQIDKNCTKSVEVKGNETLLLRIESLDIDLSRDNLKITHEFNETCTRRISPEKFRLVSLGSGNLTINFTTSTRSRSGKGFIIVYKKKYGVTKPMCDSWRSGKQNRLKSKVKKSKKKDWKRTCRKLEKCRDKRNRRRCRRLLRKYSSKCHYKNSHWKKNS